MEHIHSKHENYLVHALWLKSTFETNAFNSCVLMKMLEQADLVEGRTITMTEVEKIAYHYITNDFSRSPYKGFDQHLYQNIDPELKDPTTEILYIISVACGFDTHIFNEEIIEKYEGVQLNKFTFKSDLALH